MGFLRSVLKNLGFHQFTSSLLLSSARKKLGFEDGKLSSLFSLSKLLFSSSSVKKSTSVYIGSEYPKVVEENDLLSCLYLRKDSNPIPVLTGSKPLFNEKVRFTHWAFYRMNLTKPQYWPPPPVTPANEKYIVTHRPAKKNWYRLTTDASLSKKKEDPTPSRRKVVPREGCGWIVRNCSLEPVCTGEHMVSDDPTEEIDFYELLTVERASQEMGPDWLPLEISTDNRFVIKILDDDRLRPHIHDMDALLQLNLYEKKYLVLYQSIMKSIDAQIVSSNGRRNWDHHISFTPLPREANFAADYLANSVKVNGTCKITRPRENMSIIDPDQLHFLLNHILGRDRTDGFVKMDHKAAVQRSDFAKRLKTAALKINEVPPEPRKLQAQK